jgi:hypothetical protein
MYVADGKRHDFLKRAGITERPYAPTSHPDTQAAIFSRDGFHVLAFRGTRIDTVRGFVLDALVDADATLTEWDIGRVHTGIRNMLGGLQPIIQDFEKLPGTLYITGHSLGGALAILAAYRLRHKEPITYTFGAPFAGDNTFARAFDKMILHCVVMRRDPVPYLPPRGEGFFGAVWNILLDGHYVRAGKATEVGPMGEVEKFLRRFRLRPVVAEVNLIDHAPASYREALRASK